MILTKRVSGRARTRRAVPATWLIGGALLLAPIGGIGAAPSAGADTAAAILAAPPNASRYVPVTPTRLADSRSGLGTPALPLSADSTRSITITGSVIPATATAAMINVTVDGTQGSGWLQVFPTGIAAVGSASTLNAEANATTPNAAFTPIGLGGQISIYSTFATNVIVDVFGYFEPASAATAGRFVPLDPTRILDTRTGLGWAPPAPVVPVTPTTVAPTATTVQPTGTAAPTTTVPATTTTARPGNPGNTKNCGDFANYAEAKAWFDTYFPLYGDVAELDADDDGIPCETLSGAPKQFTNGKVTSGKVTSGKVTSGTTVSLQVLGRGGVPTSGVAAVVMNVTADQASASGWVQVAPTPVSIGTSSNLNPQKGKTVANLVVVPVGAGGKVDLYATSEMDLLADVVGYFTDSTAPSSAEGLFVPISPSRQLDTREPNAQPVLGAGTSVTIDVSDISSAAAAVTGNLTATAAATGGWVQLSPPSSPIGASSNLNTSSDNQTVANAVVSPVAAPGTLRAYTDRPAHLLLDITGWFTGTA